MSEKKLDKLIDKYASGFMNTFLLILKTILIAGGILVIIEQFCIYLANYLSKY